MPTLKLGNKAPLFKGPCTGEGLVELSNLKGKKVIIYFYQEDGTNSSSSTWHYCLHNSLHC